VIQFVEYAPPKLASRVRFPVGSYQRLEKRNSCGLSNHALGVHAWVQGSGAAIGSPALTQAFKINSSIQNCLFSTLVAFYLICYECRSL